MKDKTVGKGKGDGQCLKGFVHCMVTSTIFFYFSIFKICKQKKKDYKEPAKSEVQNISNELLGTYAA